MYNLCDPTKVEGIIFNLITYRKSQLQQALDSSCKEAIPLKKYIMNKVETSTNETITSSHNKMIDWIIKSWNYNPTDSEVEIIKMMDSRKIYALSGKSASSKKVVDEGTFGSDVKVEHIYDPLNLADDLDRLQKNYRYILIGIKKMADKVDKPGVEGMKIRTMYANWIYMINDPRVKFIDPLSSTTSYRNQKEPNKLLGCYTKTSSDDSPVDEKMATALEAYINSTLRKKDIGQTVSAFMLDAYFLFTECLKIDIFKKPGKYDTNVVDAEIEEMVKLFPDSKFSEEFIRKTNSIEEWFKYDPSDLENEFGIKPMEIVMSPLKLPGLEPLEEERYVEIKAEKESLYLAYHQSLKATGMDAEIYRNVFQSRLKILKTREDTFEIAKEVETGVIQLLPPQLYITGLDSLGLGSQLNKDLIGYRDSTTDPTDEETKKFIDALISEHINNLTNSFIDDYRRRDWSMPVLREDNPELIIKKEITDTLRIQDGIFYLLDKPMTLQLNINMTIDRKRGGNKCAITKDYLLVYPQLFIVPRLESKEGRVGLTVKRVHDRGITGANYR